MMVVLLCASGCASDNHTIGGGDSMQSQPPISDTNTDSATKFTAATSTASSQINEPTAGIFPMPNEGSDTKSEETTENDSQKPKKRPDTSESGEQPENTLELSVGTGTGSILPVPTESSQSKSDSESSASPVTSEPPTENIIPTPDMGKEYERIIRETITYAESYAEKGFTFIWDNSLEFSWETGYMGTPRVKYEGVDGVIEMLKRHIDMIVKTATDPGNGNPGYSANYKVVQVTVDGDIAFAVLYG